MPQRSIRVQRTIINGTAVLIAGGAGLTPAAQATPVWSGIVNIPIPSTADGVYLNVVTGQTGSSGATTPGWDVNPWSSSTLQFFGNSNIAGRNAYVMQPSGLAVASLPQFTTIGPSQVFGSGAAATANPNAFNVSGDNFVGFQFVNEATGNALHYGFMRISLSGTLTSQPRMIVDYTYESSPNTPAFIMPEPGSLALLAMGAIGLAKRRGSAAYRSSTGATLHG